MAMRGRRVGVFTLLSILSQLFAMVAGFIVVRGLDKHDYALYAIAFSVASAATILTNAGLRSTLLALGGQALAAGESLGAAAAAARAVRRIFATTAALPAIVVVVSLFVANGADPWTCIAAGVTVLVLLVSALVAGISRTVLQLHGRVRAIQWNMVAISAFRVAIFAAVLLIPGRSAIPYLLALAAVGAAEAVLLQIASRHLQRFEGSPQPEHRALYLANYRRTIGGAIFLVLGDQVINYTLTLVGNTDGIAEIAALSRFSILFLVLNSVVTNLFAPSVAKLPNSRSAIRRATWRLAGTYSILSLAYVGVCAVAAPILLWLLGPEYSGLEVELVIVAAGAAVSNFAVNGIGSILQSRGWLKLTWTYIPLFFVWFGIGLVAIDKTTSLGAVTFSATISLAVLASQIIRFVSGYRTLSKS